ncbi:MAG: ABC transporter permease subunit, partial [Ruminococcaceae bacterium]|nr:ABC transporter permease subunit [Oscillospiraceae bacterium]
VGIRIGLGYAWRAIVGAEMIAAASGLGYLILDAQALSRTDKVIVGVLVIGLIGLLTDGLCTLMERTVARKFGEKVQNGEL